MKSLPKIGLYVATKKDKSMRICVTTSSGEDPEDFYTVSFVDEEDKDDMQAMSNEYDNDEWEDLVEEYGLEFQND